MGHNTLPLIITVQQITIRKCKVSITGTETSSTHCRLLYDMYVRISLRKRAWERLDTLSLLGPASWRVDHYRHGGPDRMVGTLSTLAKKKASHQGPPNGSSTLALSQSTEQLVATVAGNTES